MKQGIRYKLIDKLSIDEGSSGGGGGGGYSYSSSVGGRLMNYINITTSYKQYKIPNLVQCCQIIVQPNQTT